MIPLKLELKNFLSYGDSLTTIDFSDYELICLSGKNGNGKSAILDAITWALWGNARKVSGNTKADAGLIRLGQTRMMVSMEFLCNGQRYRVRREYAKTYGKPYAALNIEFFDETQKDFVALTEKTIRQTQEKIEKIVGLDFDTFINSAFLRQGQANEFSQKTPKERKQILATILGLGKYDALQKRALEHARIHLDDRKVLEKLQEQAAIDLEQEKTLEEKLTTEKKDHKSFEKQVELAIKNREEKEQESLVFANQKYVHELKIKEQTSLQQALESRRDKLREIFSVWRRVHASSLQGPTLKILEQEREKLLAHDKKLRQAQQESVSLQEELLLIKEKLNKIILEKEQASQAILSKQCLAVEKQALQVNQFLLQKKQKERALSDRKLERDSQQKIVNKIGKELAEQKYFTKNFESFTKQFEKRRIFYQNLVQRGNWTQSQLKELAQKKQVAHDKKNPSCPLCEQILTLKRKQFLARTLARQELFLQNRLSRISAILKRLKNLLVDQHAQREKFSLQDTYNKQLQAQKETLGKSLGDLEKLVAREAIELEGLSLALKSEENKLVKEREKLARDEKASKTFLQSNKTIKTLAQERDAIEKKRELLVYDKAAHEKVLENLEHREQEIKKLSQLKDQLVLQVSRREQISLLSTELKNLKNQIILLGKELATSSYNPENEKKLKEELLFLKQQEKELLASKDLVIQEVSRLRTKLDHLKRLKEGCDIRRKQIEVCAKQAKEYQLLGTIFGKDGIQALLIENAIPQIESEANQLLSRLTDNKSQIFIESLRDLKKGGAKESLDIHISDEVGVRPYEMFSGGEAFRIDFALRIAISKLLAQRAGTALQTLIIDEGFGSQDEEGLARLMEAIYAIQKDFRKVIVVSHLPALKDNFPVHFIVEKDSLGSFVRVEERG